MINMAQFTTAQVAEKFGTTPRTLRKFLRSDAKANETTDSLPGKGSRYALEGKQLAALKKRFTAWQAAEAKARAERAVEAAQDAEDQVETDATPEPEPTPEELEAYETAEDN